MNRSQDIEQFEKRLGYRFQTLSHLQEALTHPSRGSATRQDNQRLEFLGDRVLGLVMAQALLERDPTASEGLLAPRYNALVRKEACASVARDIDIGAVLKLGRSEMMSGGASQRRLACRCAGSSDRRDLFRWRFPRGTAGHISAMGGSCVNR